jgi:hypothetical protein
MTVLEKGDTPIRDLAAADFSIAEGGVPRPVVSAARDRAPVGDRAADTTKL